MHAIRVTRRQKKKIKGKLTIGISNLLLIDFLIFFLLRESLLNNAEVGCHQGASETGKVVTKPWADDLQLWYKDSS